MNLFENNNEKTSNIGWHLKEKLLNIKKVSILQEISKVISKSMLCKGNLKKSNWKTNIGSGTIIARLYVQNKL